MWNENEQHRLCPEIVYISSGCFPYLLTYNFPRYVDEPKPERLDELEDWGTDGSGKKERCGDPYALRLEGDVGSDEACEAEGEQQMRVGTVGMVQESGIKLQREKAKEIGNKTRRWWRMNNNTRRQRRLNN